MNKFLSDYNLAHDENNIVDQIWKERPTYSKDKVIVHDVKYAGESPFEKYKRVRNTLQKKETSEKKALVIVRLDDIACKKSFNLRANKSERKRHCL